MYEFSLLYPAISGLPAEVRVKGVIRFMKAPGQERYTPVLMINDIAKDIERNVQVRNEYEF